MQSFRRATFLVIGMLQSYCSGQSDLTMTEGTFGSVVVQAVTDRLRGSCIYSDDRLFIRRLAIVQSDDGNMDTTYRNGFHGGIWQVDEDKFNTTKNCADYRIREECSLILSEFKIDWSSVQWTDLLKPLYSGLAASLYLKLRGADPVPGDLTGQASLWKSYFQPTQNLTTYTTKIQQEESTANDSCDYKPIDLVFIIDESGSYAEVLTFLTAVVDDLNIGPTAVQVGLVNFNSTATLGFNLGQFSTKTSLKSAILNNRYQTGGTSIGAGIQYADNYVFPLRHGGRMEATKIAILVTNGMSSSATFTKQAADNAKANHIRIFAVGIGNISIAELNSAASDPKCTHVSVLNNFNQTDDIIYEIKKSVCRASNPVGEEGDVGGDVTTGGGFTIEIDTVDGHNKTITTDVDCGVMNVYSSFATSHPGPAFHDQSDTAIAGSPSVLVVSVTDSRPLYVTFVRHNQDPSCPSSSYTCEVSNDPPVNSGIDILCKVSGRWQKCDSSDMDGDDAFKQICGVYENNDWNSISNPCTQGGPTYHSHPTDLAKFVTCGNTLKMYISQCPARKIYSNQGCEFAHVITFGNHVVAGGSPVDAMTQNLIICRVSGNIRECQSKDLPGDFYDKVCEGTTPSVQNPCTSCAIAEGNRMHPHPLDDNKYITCDGGNSHTTTQCPPGERFSVAKQRCISSTDNCDSIENDEANSDTSGNPCIGNPNKTLAHSDPRKYIMCDGSNTGMIMTCLSGYRFYASKSACDL